MSKPILFNAEMVRAILSGQKTVTRRPAKWRPKSPGDVSATRPPDAVRPYTHVDHGWIAAWFEPGGGSRAGVVPPYTTDDRLYVRERMCVLDTRSDRHGNPGDRLCDVLYPADQGVAVVRQPARLRTVQPGHHAANGCWREAARIWLDVVDVRPERVADLSPDEARAEGFGTPEEFRATWTKLYGWNEASWWWRIEFKRVDPRREG